MNTSRIELSPQMLAVREKATGIANQFEQMFVQQMVEGFRKTQITEGDGMFGSGPGASTYGEWFDNHMASHLTKNEGVGVARVVIRDLERLGQIPKLGTPQGINHVA